MKQKILSVILMLMLAVCTGCGNGGEPTKVILTMGFSEDEVFRIENASCSKQEIMLLLTNIQNQYENIYGAEIWEKDYDGITLEQNVKENVLAQISRIKTMSLLAEQYGVSLTEEQELCLQEAANAYYETLNETEIKVLGVTPEMIKELYREYALADTVYEYIIKDINPEISDDEARTITVQHIMFKTYEIDGTGQVIEYSDENKEEAYRRAREVLKLAKQENSDFEELVLMYSEGEEGTVSFGKGETESAFETVAFKLETGEISEIIETADGFHIIKCISTFDREQTDINKVKIVEKRKEEVFGQEYEAFAQTLNKKLNEELWKKISLCRNEEIVTSSFFSIYEQYYEN
ncbi:MAG: peptidylprolyl isomerase [Lachnospiraceae bacterium]|nr:peptidylprolyl isomerase [Lachnospiraceae bacterium]